MEEESSTHEGMNSEDNYIIMNNPWTIITVIIGLINYIESILTPGHLNKMTCWGWFIRSKCVDLS